MWKVEKMIAGLREKFEGLLIETAIRSDFENIWKLWRVNDQIYQKTTIIKAFNV